MGSAVGQVGGLLAGGGRPGWRRRLGPGPWRRPSPSGPATSTASSASNAPLTSTTPAGKRERLVLDQGPPGAGVDDDGARGADGEGDPELAAGQALVAGLHDGADAPSPATAPAMTPVAAGVGDHGPDPGPGGDLGRGELRGHATAPPAAPGRAGQRLDLLVDLDDLLDQRGRLVEPGIGGEQAGRVGEQHEQVGAEEVGDQSRRAGRCRRSGSRRRRWRRSR